MIAVFNGPLGKIIADLIAEGQSEPAGTPRSLLMSCSAQSITGSCSDRLPLPTSMPMS
jgi:hypothetical protein